MNRHVTAITNRLSLRQPQSDSLKILHRITEIVPPHKGVEREAALATIRGEFPTVTDFERDFPSLCFALATGVGKTRLMGAFISYLRLAHGINIFNTSKINSEVRGGRAPRIKRLSEYIGESYFDYLADLKDLVLIMDESHRYRASAGVRAINELNPVLGLELTATPFVETSRGPIAFKNVIYDYPLRRAMDDGFVKEPAVVTRKDFNPASMSAEEIERIKLEDGVRLHESVKVELETFARETGNSFVKPFLLVIARDTTHAGQLLQLIKSESFFDGRYKDKVIQVDSSKTGAEEDEMIQRLLAVESAKEPTEIVIHVNMLKEGWDVTNLYTIVPLRAANARTLIEQSIGRGLRLPYGKRTGVTAVDRLNIVAHDKFQEIVDEAKRPDSAIRLQQVVLNPEQLTQKTVTVVSQSQLATKFGLQPEYITPSTIVAGTKIAPVFTNPEEQKVAQLAYEVIRKLENQPQKLPHVNYLFKPEIQAGIISEVGEQYRPAQLELEGVITPPDIAAIVSKTSELITQQTINIPRILVVPKGEVRSGFKPFILDLKALNYPPVSEELWIQLLRTNQMEVLALGRGGIEEGRLEDYVVSGLVDFDDISYDDHADLLYDLAAQTVRHFRAHLSEDDTRKVLRCYQRDIVRYIHAQMQQHYWEEAVGYEGKISKGFTELKSSAYSASAQEPVLDFRQAPADKSNMARYLFGGFQHLEYQPDFVAETEDRIFMLESKVRNEMEDDDVQAKETCRTVCGQQELVTKSKR